MARNLWGRAALLALSVALLPCTPAAAAQGDDGAVVGNGTAYCRERLPDLRPADTPLFLDAAHRDVRRGQRDRAGNTRRTAASCGRREGRRPGGGGAGRARRVGGAVPRQYRDLRRGSGGATERDSSRHMSILGRLVGQQVAAEILAWRFEDGWHLPPLVYELPAFPGQYQRTPPNFPAAGATQYPGVKPFALLTETQFLPAPPPTLTSAGDAEATSRSRASDGCASADRCRSRRSRRSSGQASSRRRR